MIHFGDSDVSRLQSTTKTLKVTKLGPREDKELVTNLLSQIYP